MEIQKLKEALRHESDFDLPEDVMDEFLAGGTLRRCEAGEVLARPGEITDSIFIVADGVGRSSYLNGDKEYTTGFGTRGTAMISYHSFFMGEPTFYQLDVCCKSLIMEIPKSHYEYMVRRSHEFTRWMLGHCNGQLYCYEMRDRIINGTVQERYRALVRNRAELLQKVPLKQIATYLGITPQYLSVLRGKV